MSETILIIRTVIIGIVFIFAIRSNLKTSREITELQKMMDEWDEWDRRQGK